jgi:putative transposase
MTDKQMKVGKDQEALLDALIAGCDSPEDILGQHGLLKELQKRLMERALEAELTHHLGYEPHEHNDADNSRNGCGPNLIFFMMPDQIVSIPVE